MAFYYRPLCVFLYLYILANANLASSTMATKKSGFTTDLIHRDSALSPSYNPSNTHFDRLNHAVQRSFSRKSSIGLAHQKSTLAPQYPSNIEAPVTPASGEFQMKFSIGTPPWDIFAIVDTGSDLTWTQCLPCIDCFGAIGVPFDPLASKTYQTVACHTQQCAAAGNACDEYIGCMYEWAGPDSSYSSGYLAADTFTFNTESEGTASFPSVMFGCGIENTGGFNATVMGIVGLGAGSLSIVQQLQNTIGGKFSYCLTSDFSNATSKISFGSNALVTGPNVVSTPLIMKSSNPSYYLTLEGISVGQKKFEYVPLTSAKSVSQQGNIIIDSGTTLTFLPTDLYESLESALIKTIRGQRAPGPRKWFRLCYDISKRQIDPPTIVAHFTGADVVLPQKNLFIEVQKGLVCLAMSPSEVGLNIFGNLNQINYLIGYDLENQMVSFLPKDCSKA